jgi:hypothetical protein
MNSSMYNIVQNISQWNGKKGGDFIEVIKDIDVID